MHDAIEAIERGKSRRRCVLEIGEDVVLDNRQGTLVGKLQELVGEDRRQRGAGRIVDPGIGDVEARAMFGKCAREALDIGPAARIGDTDDLRAMRAQQGMKIEIAGIIYQHGVAGLEQEAAQQVDRLGA